MSDPKTVLKMIKDKDVKTRLKAVGALGGIGPEARSAAPAIIKALKEGDLPLTTNNGIASALVKIDP